VTTSRSTSMATITGRKLLILTRGWERPTSACQWEIMTLNTLSRNSGRWAGQGITCHQFAIL